MGRDQGTPRLPGYSDRVLLDVILRQGATGLVILDISNLCVGK